MPSDTEGLPSLLRGYVRIVSWHALIRTGQSGVVIVGLGKWATFVLRVGELPRLVGTPNDTSSTGLDLSEVSCRDPVRRQVCCSFSLPQN